MGRRPGRPKEFADTVEVRFTEEHLEFLEMLVLATGLSRSAVIRGLVATAIKSTDWHSLDAEYANTKEN